MMSRVDILNSKWNKQYIGLFLIDGNKTHKYRLGYKCNLRLLLAPSLEL